MFRQCFQLIKPGIIFGNLISVIGGFLLASHGKVVNYFLLIKTLTSVFLLIASACVINNYIDKDIDRKMERTKHRAFVKEQISTTMSLIYAILLGCFGFFLLQFINPLTCWLGIIGFVVYVCIYSLYMKRHSVYSTLIGSLAGASPPVMGYCAVSNVFDSGAFILLTIFTLWQVPHSYSISIFWFKDYQEASIPVLPVVKGIAETKNHIVLYIVSFTISTIMLFLSGYVGYKYLLIILIINLWWFIMAIRGYKVVDDRVWARKLFLFSIIVITTFSVMISIDINPECS